MLLPHLVSALLMLAAAPAWAVPHTITGHVTCDNEFAIYTAATESPGMSVTYSGVTACHPSAPAVTINTTDRYLYIAAWSDDGAAQGLLHDLKVDGVSVFSGHPLWTVTYTDSNYTSCLGTPPAAMAATMNATIPAPPGGWLAPSIGCANPPAGGNCYGVWGNFPTIDLTARRIWYNSGFQGSPNAPFQPGFNHREFLIFRLDMSFSCGSDGTPCDDGNACTQTDTCQNGTCVGSDPVLCGLDDQCHEGVCDPATGRCRVNPKPDGTPCNDGNACTQTDTCQNGVCVGSDPVLCPLTQCQDADCDPATGGCVNTPRPDGWPCNDGNACTQTDTCQNGACVGSNPVTCIPIDQCHDALCDPASGECLNTPKPDGTPCDDGNLCTTDVCMEGVCVGTATQHTITGHVTCDNEFAIYTAATESPGMSVTYSGVTACHPAAPAVTINTTDRYLYIATWSDDDVAQGLLHDLKVDGVSVFSGDPRWKVTYTDFNVTSCLNTPPATMASTMNSTIPAPPGGWTAPAVGCANPPPGGDCYGLWGNFPGIDLTARRIWYDSGGQISANAPFEPGFNHREFLIFRLDMCCIGPNNYDPNAWWANLRFSSKTDISIPHAGMVDLDRGDLAHLHATGSFGGAGNGVTCLANDSAQSSFTDMAIPPVGGGFYYLLRGQDTGCGQNFSWRTFAPSENPTHVTKRDDELNAISASCPNP